MSTKKRLKKINPNRHRAIIALRNADKYTIGEMTIGGKSMPVRYPNQLKTFVDNSGNETVLNVYKHIMLMKPYKNHEYNMEVSRFINKAVQEIEAQEKVKAEKENLTNG